MWKCRTAEYSSIWFTVHHIDKNPPKHVVLFNFLVSPTGGASVVLSNYCFITVKFGCKLYELISDVGSI